MMSRTWRETRAWRAAADAVAIVVAYVVADVLRCRFWQHAAWPERIAGFANTVPVHLWMAAVLALVWPALLWQQGWYERTPPSGWRAFAQAAAATVLLLLATGLLALLFQRDLYPRAQLAFLGLLAPATAVAAARISAWVARRGPRREHRVLIVGTDRDAVRLRRLLAASGTTAVIGHLRLEDAANEISSLVHRHAADEVVFCVPLTEWRRVEPLIAACEEMGVPASIPIDPAGCRTAPVLSDAAGVPLLTFGAVRHAPEMLAVKRGLDIVVGLLGVALTWPLMLLCAAAVRVFSPGPVLFRQVRSGLNGRTFEMLKFRTMEIGAESRIEEVGHLNESDGPVFKSRRDPRITGVGAWLRRYSLDELPQLFNVLRGEMSIVGPRPPLPSEVEKYDPWQRRRLSMRPGVTCLWQVQGRHRVGFREWMEMDLFYVDHWSLRMDVVIFFKTIAAVVNGSGA